MEDFHTFISSISDAIKEKKLIIVFDDIDRIDPNRIFDFWGVLHNLFSDKKFDNISIIVPFDRNHINSIFSNNGNSIKGNDYISKSFDIIYRVSPPILSDHAKFMRIKWAEAFDDIVSEGEYHYITQIFDLVCIEKSPRNIIAFINDFVSTKQINGYNIPERYIGLFILKREDILSDPEKKIISLDFLGQLKEVYSNEETSKYIASLVYQIDPEKALDILYKNKLRIALDNCKLKQIEEISNLPIFFNLLLNVLPDITNIENSIVSIDHISEKLQDQTAIHNQIWNEIYIRTMEKRDELIMDCDGCLPYQTSIINHLNDDAKTDFMSLVLGKIYSSDKFNSIGYYKIVKKFKEILGDSQDALDIILVFEEREVEVEQFISLVDYAKEDYMSINLFCPINSLNEYLAAKTLEDLDTLHFVKYIEEKEKLTGYESLLKTLFSNQINNFANLIKIIECLKDIGNPIDTSNIPTNVILGMYNNTLKSDFHYDVIAIRLASPTKSDSNMNIFVPLLTDENLNENDVIKISEVIQNYISFSDLLNALQQMSQFPLYCAIIKHILQNKSGYGADIRVLIKNFQLVCEKIQVVPELVLENYNAWLGFLKDTKNLQSKIESSFPVFFVQACMKSKTDIAKYVIEQIKLYLDSFTKEKWKECLKNTNGYDFQVALLIEYSFGALSIEALENVMIDIAKGEIKVENNVKYNNLFELLIKLSHRNNIKSMFNNIRDVLCSKIIDESTFIFFGKWLFEFSDIESRKEILRTILPPNLLDNPDCLNIIFTYKSHLPNIVLKSEDEKDIFIDGLKERAKKKPDSNELKELCLLLKIEIDSAEDD